MRRAFFSAILAVVGMVTACTPFAPAGPVPPPASQPQAPGSVAAASRPATSGAVIAGIVVYTGPPVTPPVLNTSTDAACTVAVRGEAVVVNPNGTLSNAFVHVQSGLGGRTFAPPKTPKILDIRGWRFVPHVLGIQAGQAMQVRQCGVTAHNVFIAPTKNPAFNIGMPRPGMIWTAPAFVRQEIGIPVGDAVHPWMSGFICVVGHPFYNVTETAGVFRLEGLPAGTYSIESWHETLGTKRRSVTVGTGQNAWVVIRY